MSKARTYNSELVNELLAETTASELLLTEKKMLLAVRIADAIKQKYRHRNDFAIAIGKKPSEISRWLSGTHNFTAETLFEIERLLEIQLFNLEPKPLSYVTYHVSLKTQVVGTGKYYLDGHGAADQILTTYKVKSIVSETQLQYVTN